MLFCVWLSLNCGFLLLLPAGFADAAVFSVVRTQVSYGITHISYLVDGNVDIFPFDCKTRAHLAWSLPPFLCLVSASCHGGSARALQSCSKLAPHNPTQTIGSIRTPRADGVVCLIAPS